MRKVIVTDFFWKVILEVMKRSNQRVFFRKLSSPSHKDSGKLIKIVKFGFTYSILRVYSLLLSFCLSFLLIHWIGKRWTTERAVTRHFDLQRCQVKSKGARSNWYAFVIFIISHYYHSNSSFHSKVKTLTFMGVSESHYHMQTQHETCIGLIKWRKSTKCLVMFQNWEVSVKLFLYWQTIVRFLFKKWDILQRKFEIYREIYIYIYIYCFMYETD